MRELINNLKASIDKAKLECACRKPSAEWEASYLLGYLQGKYTGFSESLKIVEAYLEGEEQKEEFR